MTEQQFREICQLPCGYSPRYVCYDEYYAKPLRQTEKKYMNNDIQSMYDLWRIAAMGDFETGEFDMLQNITIKNVHFSGPCTIVIWNDGTKTIVRQNMELDPVFDAEKGLAMAIAKKFLGTNKSKSNYYDEFKKWLPHETDDSK